MVKSIVDENNKMNDDEELFASRDADFAPEPPS